MRVVLDTNVLLAGLATHGLCEALLKLVYRDHVVADRVSPLSEAVYRPAGPTIQRRGPLSKVPIGVCRTP